MWAWKNTKLPKHHRESSLNSLSAKTNLRFGLWFSKLLALGKTWFCLQNRPVLNSLDMTAASYHRALAQLFIWVFVVVVDRWGRSLVVVASQPQRNFVLTGSLVLPTMLTDTIQRYYLLERIGRSVVCVLVCFCGCVRVCSMSVIGESAGIL